MNNKTQVHEILAWITLSIVLILTNVAFSFAQTKTIDVENEDGKVHIKINKTENGKTVKIDTTFNVTDDMNMDEILETLGESEEASIQIQRSTSKNKRYKNNKKEKQIVIDFDFPEMSKADKEKLHEEWNESMEDMRSGIEKMKKSLKSMHIHINNEGKEKDDFDFNFDWTDEESRDKKDCKDYSYSYKFSHDGDKEIDSLSDDDHIVIVGKKDEAPPKLEKVITSKNGKQIFVYKRTDSANESGSNRSKAEKPDIHNLYFFPNPTNGKFNLSFRSEEKGDLTIQVLDNNSKVVLTDTRSNFEGEFSKEFDIGTKSKGNYFLKIIQNGKSITKKIVLN